MLRALTPLLLAALVHPMSAQAASASGPEDAWRQLEPDLTSENAFTALSLSDPPQVVEGEDITPGTRVYDIEHTYVLESEPDRADRAFGVTLPSDPDWQGSGAAPVVEGQLGYSPGGLARTARAWVDGASYWIIQGTNFERDDLPSSRTFGDTAGGTRVASKMVFKYDSRRRPARTYINRAPTAMSGIGAMNQPLYEKLLWDEANNLVRAWDPTSHTLRPAGHRQANTHIGHDALYRVVSVSREYKSDTGSFNNTYDPASDWRDERVRTNGDMQSHESVDPMRERPASMLPDLPPGRYVDLQYEYDFLANMTAWDDDASSFYERSIGAITNGLGETGLRPTALYLSTNIRQSSGAVDPLVDRGGWLEVDYGVSGNVVGLTVHAQCHDPDGSTACYDDVGTAVSARRSHLRSACICDAEQHYQYRWDELDRLAEARRYDRSGIGDWHLGVRQRYRYDAGNQRMVKQTLDDQASGSDPPEAVALYVYPGEYERRGLVTNTISDTYDADATLETETHYMIAGARIVWEGDPPGGHTLSRDVRITYAFTNLIGSNSVVIDLYSGEVLSATTYYPNGALENLWTQDQVSVAPHPEGFTAKEADDEVGVVYFGERYLIPHIGRWASPDPLHVHAVGGGEVLNSYHYVSGNLLQARDPLGLRCTGPGCEGSGTAVVTEDQSQVSYEVRVDEAAGEMEYFEINQASAFQREMRMAGVQGVIESVRSAVTLPDPRELAESYARFAMEAPERQLQILYDALLGDVVTAFAPAEGMQGMLDRERAGGRVTGGAVVDAGATLVGASTTRIAREGMQAMGRVRRGAGALRQPMGALLADQGGALFPGAPGGLASHADDMARGAAAADRNGLTAAGRALQKHSSRSGSAFSRSGNRARDLNARGQEIVEDLLTDPGSTFTSRTIRDSGNAVDVIDVVGPRGEGARFHANDFSLRGFLEP